MATSLNLTWIDNRCLAVIDNNVNWEYMEYCLKGLADRLRWKFGDDDKKFQRVTRLFSQGVVKEHIIGLRRKD